MCETIQMMRSRVIAGDDETPMWNWHSNQDSHSKVCEKKTDYQISINETLKSIGIRVRRSHALKPWKISFLFIFFKLDYLFFIMEVHQQYFLHHYMPIIASYKFNLCFVRVGIQNKYLPTF